jgi:hypothetical protein
LPRSESVFHGRFVVSGASPALVDVSRLDSAEHARTLGHRLDLAFTGSPLVSSGYSHSEVFLLEK